MNWAVVHEQAADNQNQDTFESKIQYFFSNDKTLSCDEDFTQSGSYIIFYYNT